MPPESRPHYLPQLDGLRAIAVSAVMLAHFAPEGSWIGPIFPWGQAGVRLFFELSGYLITGILLRGRERIDRGEATTRGVARTFYVRRVLRIFPLYYATLLVLCFVMPALRSQAGWFFSYLDNFLIFREGRSVEMGHFWSLAVEEQFYLLWPWLPLLLPRRLILPSLVMMVVVGPITRAFALLAGYNAISATILMPSCLDTLGMGSLLAFLENRQTSEQALTRLGRLSLVLGLLIWAPFLAMGSQVMSQSHALCVDFGMALIFFWIVLGARRGFLGFGGRFLGSRTATWMGKISYGIYVLHIPVRATLGRVWHGGAQFPWLLAAGSAVGTVALAAASWHFFEKPLNDLKARFEYR